MFIRVKFYNPTKTDRRTRWNRENSHTPWFAMPDGRIPYFYVVKAYRQDGKTRQKIVAYLGSLPNKVREYVNAWNAKHPNKQISISPSILKHFKRVDGVMKNALKL